MFLKKSLALATTAIAIIALTGCSNPAQTAKYQDALSAMVESPLEGYELSTTDEPTCGFDYCNPNFTYIFTSSTKEDQAPFCAAMIDWAAKSGADSWFYDPEYIALPLKGHEGAALYACFGGNQFNLAGTTKGIRWTVNGTPGQIVLSSIMNREGGLDDDRMKPHTWDEGRALLFEGDRLNMDILSAIETYRTENPKANHSSTETIMKALKGIDLPDGFRVVNDSMGKAHYLEIPADDVMLERCINITPFDENFFGFPNPKSGFTVLYILDGNPATDQFGYTYSGKCK